MPRSQSPGHYAASYPDFLRNLSTTEPTTLPLPSPAHAKTLRGKLYSYFTSLREVGVQLELIAVADAVELSLDGPHLVVTPREQTWDSLALKAAVAAPAPAPVPVAVAVVAPVAVPHPALPSLVSRLAELRENSSK